MTPRRWRTHLRAALAALPHALVVLAVALFAASAWARPGGGQSFGGRSGGGSHGGGGGGGGGGELVVDLVVFLLELTIEHPTVGVPLDLVVLGVVAVAMLQKGRKNASWSTSSSSYEPAPTAAAKQAQARARPSRLLRKELLATVSRGDPNFSIVLFEDFLYALYAAAHEARGKGQLGRMAPYLRPDARQVLADRSRGLTEVRTPVIGALRYLNVAAGAVTAPVHVEVELEANYTELGPGGEHTFYVVDRWTLVRSPAARARPPERASILGCPNCGAPLDDFHGNTCKYCGQVVDTGHFDWIVSRIDERDRMERPPQLTGDTPDTGIRLPTAVDPEAAARMQALTRKDPAFQWPRFLQRVALIHAEIQPAWSTLEWARARPYVSDQLFQMLAYWIESYRREHLRNVTENARITGIELAAVVSDRYYDAITVRLYATGLDYTVNGAGHVVSGSKTRERPYTEYWTLIRGSTVASKATGDRACPNCGAPLSISMAGACTHCSAKVTSGDFDWVLSRIEQDEAYTG